MVYPVTMYSLRHPEDEADSKAEMEAKYVLGREYINAMGILYTKAAILWGQCRKAEAKNRKGEKANEQDARRIGCQSKNVKAQQTGQKNTAQEDGNETMPHTIKASSKHNKLKGSHHGSPLLSDLLVLDHPPEIPQHRLRALLHNN